MHTCACLPVKCVQSILDSKSSTSSIIHEECAYIFWIFPCWCCSCTFGHLDHATSFVLYVSRRLYMIKCDNYSFLCIRRKHLTAIEYCKMALYVHLKKCNCYRSLQFHTARRILIVCMCVAEEPAVFHASTQKILVARTSTHAHISISRQSRNRYCRFGSTAFFTVCRIAMYVWWREWLSRGKACKTQYSLKWDCRIN